MTPKTPTKIAVDSYIGAELDRLNDHGKGTSWRDLAAVYGISHVHAREIAMTGTGVGQRLEATWAEKHFGGSVDELRRAAEAWAREHGVWEAPAGTMTLDEPRAWLSELALGHVRMRPALEMGLDAGIPLRFLRDFVEEHDGDGPDLPSAQWWNLLQVEHAQYMATLGESPAHAQLRELAHAETANGRFVGEDMLTALRAAHVAEPADGWLAAIDRERVRYGKESLRGDFAKRKASAEEKRRRREAKRPAAAGAATGRKRAVR